MCSRMMRGARQLGAHSCCANRVENALWRVCFIKGSGALEEAGGGTEGREEILYNAELKLSPLLGRGWPESCRVTKRQCGLVTVRGKHMATNGTVMGGEETWEKLVQESWYINSGGVTSLLGRGTGATLSLSPKPTPEMFPLPGLRPG